MTRHRVLKTTGAAAAATTATGLFGGAPLPLIGRRDASAQDEPLTFWQFYSPGGTVSTQVAWFKDMVDARNAENEKEIEPVYVPSQEYVSDTKLHTAFASGEGPNIFLISPGDFLQYANGGVLADLSPSMEQEAIDDFFPDVITSRYPSSTLWPRRRSSRCRRCCCSSFFNASRWSRSRHRDSSRDRGHRSSPVSGIRPTDPRPCRC